MKSILLKSLLIKARQKTTQSKQSEAGFSLLEVMIVVVIMGIFAAIAAPAWDAFVNRQRIRTVNNQVLRTLQTAQAEAKGKNQEVAIQFDQSADPPAFRVGQPDTIGSQPEQRLDLNGEIPEGAIQIYVQANNNDDADDDGDDAVDAITFDYMGAVEYPKPDDDINPPQSRGFTVTVSTPNGGLRRCVKVVTILGAMITAEGDDCPPN